MAENQKKTREEVDALTKPQFAAYAKDVFGYSLDERKTKGDMLAAFEKAGGDYSDESADVDTGTEAEADTDVDAEAGETGAEKDTAAPKAKPMSGEWDPRLHPRRTITINSSEAPGGGDDVVLGVNGHILRIKRDVKVSIPEPHVQVLRDAKQTIYTTKNVGGEIVKTSRQVPSYPFEDHGLTKPGDDVPGAPPATPYDKGTSLRRG